MEAQQPRHSMPTAPGESLGTTVSVHARTPVPAIRLLVRGANLRPYGLRLLGSSAPRALTPGIEPAARHGHDAAQYLHRILRLLRLNDGRAPRDSLAKKAR
jgi:hypothetical protein